MNSAVVVAVGIFVTVFLAVGAVAWLALGRRSRSGGAHGGVRRPSAVAVWGVFAAATVVTLLTIAAFTKIAVRLLDPISTVLARAFWSIFLHPGGALVLALIVLLAGLRVARRFRSPSRFTTGVVLVGVALATFWPLQYVAGSFDSRFWEWEAALHGAAGFLSVCLLSGGLETMRRANNTPKDDSWEFWS